MTALHVALAGNPNTGKTTIFNTLTGARQKIGNWPGVTVDKKSGHITRRGQTISIIDLPGTYSLNARSAEEKIVVDYLTRQRPDIVVNVLDASNLERNLYLTLQLLEYGIPVALTLNMMDEAGRKGIAIDCAKLEELLGMPVITTVARSHAGVKPLLELFDQPPLQRRINLDHPLLRRYLEKVAALKESLLDGEALEEELAALRYTFIDRLLAQTVRRETAPAAFSDRLDAVLTHRWLGIPLFFAIIYLVFELTFTWIGQPLSDILDAFISDTVAPLAALALESLHTAAWLRSLVVDGVIGGVGSVVVFVPIIFSLFFCLSFLDGIGYMARVAFLLDPIMRRVGLNGKAIMPMIIGFGCNVPALMSTRALDTEKDRRVAALTVPFMSCGAKLPVYALFAAVFFPDYAGAVILSLYALGVVVAVAAAKTLAASLFKREDDSFLLELPPYRTPNLKSVWWETWDKGKGFLVKAGTIIFAMSVAIWFLSNYNLNGPADMPDSFLAAIGGLIAPLFTWHGFGGWQSGAAMLSGILAKESVVATLAILYGAADASADAADAAFKLHHSLGGSFTYLSAYAFLTFILLYTPCMAAIGAIHKELHAWRWTIFAAVYPFAVAWVVSLMIYQGGRLLGF